MVSGLVAPEGFICPPGLVLPDNSTVLHIPARVRGAFFDKHNRYRQSRYKILFGGRGGAKSWGVGSILPARVNAPRSRHPLTGAKLPPHRILCAREFQTSIGDSVHKLLVDRIEAMRLTKRFKITDKSIYNPHTGAEFIFKGLRRNLQEIKSMEGITVTWVEEARAVSKESWQVLRPTVMRTPLAELIATFNTDQVDDPVYNDFVVHKPPGAIVRKVGWEHNDMLPLELDDERRHMLQTDPEAYEWVWGGHPRKVSDAQIFKNRVTYDCAFEDPEGVRPYYGGDWGFSNDPTALIRCFIIDDDLYISHEAFGYGVEIDETAALFDKVPGSRYWPMHGDNSRPETISYMRRQGFNIEAADKWPGSVEDGIAHLKGFRNIYVHQRCRHIAQEFRLYSYKVDKVTEDVLPIIVDKHNHGIDALRYALNGFIQKRGGLGVWEKLV